MVQEGRHYDASQWLEFECEGIEPTAELRAWAEEFSERANQLAKHYLLAEHGPKGLLDYETDVLAWKAYASIVGAGVGLWEKSGETGLSGEDEVALDTIVKKDTQLRKLAEQIDHGCFDLREKGALGAGERSAHDFPGDDAALAHAASKLGATHFLIPLKREYDVAYYVYSPARTGYFERRVIYKKRGLYHFAKTSDFVALPKDAVPMKKGTSYGETHARETDLRGERARQLYGPQTPRMQPGYAFYSPKRQLDWVRIDNDDWEHVVVDEDEIGQMEYVGSRSIDGSMHDIFKRVFAPRSVGFYAQLQHMTRGGQAGEAPRGGGPLLLEFPTSDAAADFFTEYVGRAKLQHRVVEVFDHERRHEAIALAQKHRGHVAGEAREGGEPSLASESDDRFDSTLKVGDTIEARWTWGYENHTALARVTKLSKKSLRATLLEAYAAPVDPRRSMQYALPKGHEIVLPRAGGQGWSQNNGAFPPQGGGPFSAAEGHKGEVVYMGDLSRPDADRIANGLRREEQKLRKLGGRGNYMDVRVEFQYERPSGNRFQVIVVPLQDNPRVGRPLPHGSDGAQSQVSKREAREGDDAVPWVRITRDPKLYEEGIRRAKEIGPIDGGRQIYELLSPALAVENQEVFLVVLCNLRQECIGVAEVHRGERSRVAVSRADILQVVTKSGADHFHVVHNHPSGDPTPSEADRKLTEAIQDGAAEVEIPCVDHVVIGMGKFYSFAEGKVTKVR